MTITRVQTNAHLTSYSASLSTTLAQTPTAGNVIIAAISTFNGWGIDSSVSSITQTNVTWVRKVKNQSSDNVFDVEIWVGIVSISGSADRNVNISLFNAPSQGIIAEICEYSGLSPNMDVYAISNGNSHSAVTGTPNSQTNWANELWVGAIYAYYNEQNSETNGFTRLDGTYNNNLNSFVYLEKIVSTAGSANSGTTTYGYEARPWYGCIATFVANGTDKTVTVPYDGRYVGNGSKQSTWYYAGANTIMAVQSNMPNNPDKSAVIENLIIDGLNQPGTIGIDLTNVYNCCIRNVTIMNCAVGILVNINGSSWAHGNRFEHIRMIGVVDGFHFIGNENGGYFGHTTIDDVGISTRENYPSETYGILINQFAKLYSSFIKATVWLRSSDGTGMSALGELKLSLVNFEVEQDAGRTGGVGLLVGYAANICDNQSFLLTTGNITSQNQVTGTGSRDNTLQVQNL
jgi:hypothetical protein